MFDMSALLAIQTLLSHVFSCRTAQRGFMLMFNVSYLCLMCPRRNGNFYGVLMWLKDNENATEMSPY